MTKLNLINKHWLNIQCSSCRHDVSAPVQKFIDLGINDIFQVKAKSKCKQCGRKGDDVVVRFFQNEIEYAYVTTIREKKRFRDANGDVWQGYGCVRTLIEQENYQQLLTDTNNLTEDDWAKYEKGWLEWYLVPEDQKNLEDLEADSVIDGIGGKHWDNDIFFARAVDTVVGCERRLNFQRAAPTGPRTRRPVDDILDGADFFGGERHIY